jgi:hypothetical protein
MLFTENINFLKFKFKCENGSKYCTATVYARPMSPELVYTIVDPYGFTKSLFTIESALDFLWGRGMVHCRLLAV